MAEYKFAATLKKQALSVAKQKDEGGESYEVPKLTITLELVDRAALGVAGPSGDHHDRAVPGQ